MSQKFITAKNKILALIFCTFLLHSQEIEDLEELLKSQNLNLPNSEILEDASSEVMADMSVDSEGIYSELQNELPENQDEIISEDSLNKIFGIDFIKSSPKSISGTSDLPVPNEYVISLGDEVQFILSGNKESIFTLKVGLDGTVLFPEIGKIQLSGETFKAAQDKVRNIINVSYIGVNVDMSLQSLNAKKINIIGAVKKPGTYLVNPFATISNVLAYSGGVEDYASLRDITILRSGEQISFDLYDLLIRGNRESDINIQQGDTIFVSSTNNLIEIIGSVKRPMTYQYKSNETLKDLIKFSMGFDSNSNKNNLSIMYYDESSQAIVTKELEFEKGHSLDDFNNPISLTVFSVESSSSVDIAVLGPLKNSGMFDANEYETLEQLLSDLELTDRVNPFIGIVQNENFSGLFSLEDPKTHLLNLGSNFEIFFFDKDINYDEMVNLDYLSDNSKKLIEDYSLNIYYQDQEIKFPVFGAINVSKITDYLGLDTSDIVRDKTLYLKPTVNEGVIVDDFTKIVTESSKLHSITFRHYIENSITVTIAGEVKHPGEYILSSSFTLNELYTLSGGLKRTADSQVAIFSRESVRENNLEKFEQANDQLKDFIASQVQKGEEINPLLLELVSFDEPNNLSLGRISGDFTIDTERNKNFLLEDGDNLFIPKKLSTVSVIGEVLNPSTFLHKNLSLSEYVDLSGGYNQFALKKSVYLIRANGEIIKYKGIFRDSVNILPGDTIVVPRDLDIRDDWQSLLIPITTLLSNLAFASASLKAIQG